MTLEEAEDKIAELQFDLNFLQGKWASHSCNPDKDKEIGKLMADLFKASQEIKRLEKLVITSPPGDVSLL